MGRKKKIKIEFNVDYESSKLVRFLIDETSKDFNDVFKYPVHRLYSTINEKEREDLCKKTINKLNLYYDKQRPLLFAVRRNEPKKGYIYISTFGKLKEENLLVI